MRQPLFAAVRLILASEDFREYPAQKFRRFKNHNLHA